MEPTSDPLIDRDKHDAINTMASMPDCGSSVDQEKHDSVISSDAPTTGPEQFKGWRLKLTMASVLTGLFLSFIDSTIVSVAAPSIGNHFHDYSNASWAITSYLISYMAFGIIMARISDFLGRKTVEVIAFSIFIVFSLASGLSSSMNQLIIFRALQGIGGSGLYSMTMLIALNIVDQKKAPMMSAVVAFTQVIAGLSGPLLGGAITHNRFSDNWRWIFFINLPIGGVALLTFILAWPPGARLRTEKLTARQTLCSVDFLGAVLLLALSALLVFALQQAGNHTYSWSSPTVIICLSFASASAVLFVAWQLLLHIRPSWAVKPMFPVEIAKMRMPLNTIIVTFFTGFMYYNAIVDLPQRFQLVMHNSPIIAGVKVLPMMVASALGSFTAGALWQKSQSAPYVTCIGCAIQLLGYGLMSSSSAQNTLPNTYGFEVLLGFGFGVTIASATVGIQKAMQDNMSLLAAAQGSLTQMRSLGGSVGLAIAVIIFNAKLRSSAALTTALSPSQLEALCRSPFSVLELPLQDQELISELYALAFQGQMRVTTYIAAACFFFSLLTIDKKVASSI